MTGFIEGEAHLQATFFPEVLDDYITEENPVRVVDVFVDNLDLSGLRFKTEPAHTPLCQDRCPPGKMGLQ